ncbi:MAG: protein kinase domain-containing protein [Thermoanaerobaculia bacterium]
MERIGHYRIIEEMGRGGMGVVYKGYEESLSRFVAIKVLGEHLTRDPLFVKRFQREAQAAARISHPHIVPIYYVGEDAGRHFFAMEYLTGGSLESELGRSGRIEPARAARWMLETARGLAAAHAEGLIHRDIKPANLLLDREGHVKIADFGLAKATTQATRLTGTGLFLGSPGYLSPEQCRGEELDGRSDVYSLGVTFYELLSGQIPFGGDSPAALVLNIIQSEPPAIEELNPNVDAELRRILGRMMAKDRDSRYLSARDLVRDLDAYVMTAGRASRADTVAAGAPTRLHGDTELAPTVVEAAPAAAAAVPETHPVVVGAPQAPAANAPAPRRSSRLGLLVASIVVVGILVAGAAGWGLWSWMRQGLENREDESLLSQMISAFLDDEAGQSSIEGHLDESPGDLAADSEDAGGYDPGSPEPDPYTQEPAVSDPVTTTPSAPRSVAPSAPAPVAASGTLAVVALGEPLMADLVEGYLEERLQAYGHSLVDEEATAEGLTLFGGEQDPPLESVLRLLRPRAERLVLIQVEYLDGRPLTYLGRSDTAYRSRVSIRALDLASGGAVGTAVEEEVEYTALNASQAARKAFGTAVRQFIAAL